MSGYGSTPKNSNVARDQQIDVLSRNLLKSEPYLQALSQKDPRRALKEAIHAAGRLVNGQTHGLPPV